MMNANENKISAFLKVNAKRLIFLTVAILAFNLIYWLIIKPTIFAGPKNLDLVPVTGFRYVQIDSPNLQAADGLEYVDAEIPFEACCAPQYHALQFDFELEEIPENGLGFIKVMQVDNFRLYVNKSLVVSQGRMRAGNQTFHGQPTNLKHIPANLLQLGSNRLDIITVRDSTPYTDVSNPVLGEYESLRTGARQRLWVMHEYRHIIAIIAIVIGLVCLLLTLRSKYRLFLFWFGVLSLVWGANSIKEIIMDWPLDGKARYLYYTFFNLLAPIALFNLVDSWTKRPKIRLQIGLTILWILLFAYLSYRYLYTETPGGYLIGDTVISWVFLLVSLAAILRFLVHFITTQEDRVFEVAALSLIGFSIALDAYSEIVHHVPGGNTAPVAPVFLITMLLAFLNRNFHLFRSTEQINTYLSSELLERKKELAEAYENRKHLIRKQAHNEERQRLMRDMHDGLGSGLMSMLLSAKRGKSKPADVAVGLQSVIDEMRLMIDSMDSVGESVDVALKTFRERAESRVTEADMKFVWNDHTTVDLEGYTARDILQIFRILQEATTNAIRHSNGTLVRVDINDNVEEPIGIQIDISDDGKGLHKENKRGRGLKNMETRAHQIEAKFTARKLKTGYRVSLTLPKYKTE